MKIQVLLFGIARDIVGSSQLTLDHEGGLDVKSFKQILKDKYPKMNHLSYFKVAVNQEFARDDQLLSEGDEIALIPPVSGGIECECECECASPVIAQRHRREC